MHTYTPRTFTLPQLPGISEESVRQHLALYEAYVKNFNAQTALLGELLPESTKYAHAISEIIRRRSFEFDGMRLHELYFAQFEGGARAVDTSSHFATMIAAQFGTIEAFVLQLKNVALMRGPGWALVYHDTTTGQLHLGFAGEQHQGHFATLPIVLALDVWEHAFLLDYGATGKAKYIDAFFANLAWNVIESRVQ
jgi:Fe-Mn family superoxide dismutase